MNKLIFSATILLAGYASSAFAGQVDTQNVPPVGSVIYCSILYHPAHCVDNRDYTVLKTAKYVPPPCDPLTDPCCKSDEP